MLRDKAFKAVLAALNDRDAVVRFAAVKNLWDGMGESAIEPLGTICRDTDWNRDWGCRVGKQAVESLIKIGTSCRKENSPAAIRTLNLVFKSLAFALDSPKKPIRLLAAAALYEWRWKPVEESHRLLLLEIAEADRYAKGPEGTRFCDKCKRWRRYYDGKEEYDRDFGMTVVSIHCSTCHDRLGGHARD
jgi:hypothetical protein